MKEEKQFNETLNKYANNFTNEDAYLINDYLTTLQQENKQLKRIIKENTILIKDEYGDYQECNINPLRMKQKYEKQVDNWNKLKQIIDVKMYNSEYLINLCGYKVDVDTLEILKIIKEEMQELEQGSDSK